MSPEEEVRSFNSSFYAAVANSDVDAMVGHFAPEVRWW
jgi:ketosteroid isomerase-like protein